mgnify:CR=1 FL=1
MKNRNNAHAPIIKIGIICIVMIFSLMLIVRAGNIRVQNVTIELSNGSELNVMTSKVKVSEILEENHILVLEDEKVIPDLESELGENKLIKVVKNTDETLNTTVASNENVDETLNKILEDYGTITEKIVVEQVEIPYETITKDVSNGSGNTQNRVLQQGQNGLKEITYRIKYKNDIEIEKTEISSVTIKEPVDKIIQVSTKQTSRSSSVSRTSSTTASSGKYKITAYCPCMKCCGKTNGITAMGTKATANHTVAASSQFAFGTKLKINGIVYTVEDRGGAIYGNRIDIYMNSHAEALAWGVRYLDVEVVQ